MAAFNFQRRFKPMILSGRKYHTIRADRKDGRRPNPGERLHLFCGMRTRACERLTDPCCTKVSEIEISQFGSIYEVVIDGDALSRDEKQVLAYHDGFDSFAEMMSFWDGRLPFKGFVTFWNPNEAIARRFPGK